MVTRNTSSGIETPLAYVTDYSVTGVGEGAGGTVTLTSALASGYTMAITRVVPIVQDTDLRNQGTFYPQTYEDALDYLTAIDQQQEDAIERSLKLGDAIDPATFDTAISTVPAGAYLRVNAAGDAFEAAVGTPNDSTYTASGAGAVTRTVTSKLGDFLSVRDFGASASATATTNTTAINAAITAAIAQGGKWVYFPADSAGAYTFNCPTAMLTAAGTEYCGFPLLSNTRLYFEPGAVLKLANGVSSDAAPKRCYAFLATTPVANITMIGGTIDMNGVNNPISPNRGSLSYNRYNFSHIALSSDASKTGSAAARADDVYLERMQFINCPGTNAIVMAQTANSNTTLGQRWRILHCNFFNNGIDTDDHSTVYGWATSVTIDDCTFTNDTMDGTVGNTGMTVATEIHGASFDFTNNRLSNCYRGLWIDGNTTADVANIFVANNTIGPCKAFGVDFAGGALSQVRDVDVDGNSFIFQDDNITSPPQAAINMLAQYAPRDVRITNNTALKTGLTVPAAFVQIGPGTIVGSYPTGITIEGNTMRGFYSGIGLAGNTSNGLGVIRVANNVILNPLKPGGSYVNPTGIGYSGSLMLGLGSTNTRVASLAFNYAISGTQYAKAAVAAGTALAAGTIPIGTWGIYRFSINAAGTITSTAGAANFTTGYATETLARAGLPALPASSADMGFITVQTHSGTTFIGGTDALAGGTGGNVASNTFYYPVYSIENLTIQANTIADSQTPTVLANAVYLGGHVVHLLYTGNSAVGATRTLNDDNIIVQDPRGTFTGTAVYDFPSIANASSAVMSLTMNCARQGMIVGAAHSLSLQGMSLTGYVNTVSQVYVLCSNLTGGAVDLASGTITATVSLP